MTAMSRRVFLTAPRPLPAAFAWQAQAAKLKDWP
jgi:hypothetical protein